MRFAISVAVCVGMLIAQFHLSRRENPWAGLFLPGVSFGLSFYFCSVMSSFLHTIPEAQPLFIQQMLCFTFLFANIPTALHVLLYGLGRWYMHRKNQLKRMNIRDLE